MNLLNKIKDLLINNKKAAITALGVATATLGLVEVIRAVPKAKEIKKNIEVNIETINEARNIADESIYSIEDYENDMNIVRVQKNVLVTKEFIVPVLLVLMGSFAACKANIDFSFITQEIKLYISTGLLTIGTIITTIKYIIINKKESVVNA